MGNTQTQNKTDPSIQVPHEKFKIIQILQSTNQMILTIPFQHKSDIIEWQKLLKNVKDCDSQFLLMPKKYLIAEEGLCGSSGLMKIVFDNFTYSFDQQIRNHLQKSKHFQQAQIWYLLFAIISSIKQMDRLSFKVGDIRPYNIFVNQNGQVKLAGIFSWPKQIQNYLKTSFDKTITYLAPQQLIQCRIGQKSKKSHIIGQSFSVGLTLLHTCLLRPMEDLYNVKKYEFNTQKLQSLTNQLKNLTFWNDQRQRNQKYSDQLIDIIIRLIDIKQDHRLTSLQLFQELQPHAQQILNLKEFNAPRFVQHTPIKQQPKKSRYTNQEQMSAQYSSIKKKQYNDGESLGFQISYKIPESVNANLLTQKNSFAIGTKQVTPQRNNQIMSNPNNQSPNLENVKIHPRSSLGSRQSLSKQKYQSNPVVKFNNTAVQGQYAVYQPPHSNISNKPSFYPPSEFKITANNNISNYTTYQSKYEPSQVYQYRNSSQPTPVFFNQQSYHQQRPSIDPLVISHIPHNNFPTSTFPTSNFNGTPYPFSQNINLATSGYTYIEKSVAPNIGQHNFVPNGPSTINTVTRQNYQTSIVHPVIIGDGGANNGNSEQLDFLKRIDQQLNKSRQQYPSKNV